MKIITDFARDTRGNFAVFTAFAFMAMIPAVGLAIDYSNASRERSAMSSALDAGLLGAANDKQTDKAILQERLTKLYKANGGLGIATILDVNSDGTVNAQATAERPVIFGAFLGGRNLEIAVGAQVKRSPPPPPPKALCSNWVRYQVVGTRRPLCSDATTAVDGFRSLKWITITRNQRVRRGIHR